MKKYIGEVKGKLHWVVWIEEDGKRSPLPLMLNVSNHSPTGFSWGYMGSGPSQLALALLCSAVGRDRAVSLYQDFKFSKIAVLPQDKGWEMTDQEIKDWVKYMKKYD